MENFKLNTIEEALEDFREGKFVIVVDDEDRENEGDLICAAEKITPEMVNFMLKNARGLLCAPITISRSKELDLPHQVQDNTSLLGTPFTVTIDKIEGCTTGVSAHDRAATIKALADPTSTPQTFGRPGHVNPLYAQDNGVLRRSGHTEAAIDLCKLSGLYPVGALMEIMNDDGTMARMPQLMAFAQQHQLKIITIKDMIAYRLKKESLIEVGEEADLPTDYGHFKLIPFRQVSNGLEHLALIKGEWKEDEPLLVRVHSSCMTGDILSSKRCDCGEQLHKAMQTIEKEGKGVIIYMQQEGRGIGLMNKIAGTGTRHSGRQRTPGFQARRARLRMRCTDAAPPGCPQNATADQQPREARGTGSLRTGDCGERAHRGDTQSLQPALPGNEEKPYGTYVAFEIKASPPTPPQRGKPPPDLPEGRRG